jgi:monofunctional biosynthetic peptidoglycan transglycosylase
MKVLRWTGLCVAALAAAGFAYLAYVYLTLPDVRPLIKTNPMTTAFMDIRAAEAKAAGKPVRRAQRWVSYERISSHLKRAVLVTEDAAFFDHEGIDFDELEKSFELNWRKGQFLRGGSTITQQLAKNLYLSPSKNPLRKIREFLIARRLEAELSKRRILEIYLNVIEWGDGTYGIEAAARQYFGQPAAGLAPDQSAMLAAVIINPRRYNAARPTPWLLRRQQLIMRRMGVVEPPASEGPDAQPSSPTGAIPLPPDPEPAAGDAAKPRAPSAPSPIKGG